MSRIKELCDRTDTSLLSTLKTLRTIAVSQGEEAAIIGICYHKGMASILNCFSLDFALSDKIVSVFASGFETGYIFVTNRV